MGVGQELLPVRFIHVIVMALASQLPSNGRKAFCNSVRSTFNEALAANF